MTRTFLEASVPDLVRRLKVDEKISLLGAPNWWNTTSIPRLGIPSVRMSDGPNVNDFIPARLSVFIYLLLGCSWLVTFCFNSCSMHTCEYFLTIWIQLAQSYEVCNLTGIYV